MIYASPLRLGLRIFCKSGKPIKHILRAWPTLPLVVWFKGSPNSKSLPENVVIALSHTDRVCEIDLGVTNPISQPIADVMQVPFPALECIRLAPNDAAEPPAISGFLGGVGATLEHNPCRRSGHSLPSITTAPFLHRQSRRTGSEGHPEILLFFARCSCQYLVQLGPSQRA